MALLANKERTSLYFSIRDGKRYAEWEDNSPLIPYRVAQSVRLLGPTFRSPVRLNTMVCLLFLSLFLAEGPSIPLVGLRPPEVPFKGWNY